MKKLISLIAAFTLFCTPAEASCGARGFGSTLGVGSTDVVISGYTTALATTVSISAWVWGNASGGGGLGRISCVLSSGSCVHAFGYNGSTAQMIISMPWSTTNGSWTFTAPSTAHWHSIVFTYNSSSTSNKPIVYVDGSTVTVTTTVTPVGSYNPPSAAINLGNNGGTATRNWDGKIADYGYWNAILTANEALSLSQGASPLQIRPASLQTYFPLCGTQSNEPDWASRNTQTITGTKGIAGPANQPYPFLRGAQ